ncbi:MAG: hypothetical protein ACM3SU_15765 [Acidobacteriota bacterium]
MKRALLPLLAALLSAGCTTALTREGARVKVYATDPSVPDAARSLPEGCRLLETTAPFDQQESERAGEDPYRRQRNEAGAKGGNVLLVDSKPIVLRPNTDCSPRDKSPACLEASQSWYRVSFGYYACSPEAIGLLDARAESSDSSGPLFAWKLGSSRVTVTQVKARILAMMHEGVGPDVIAAYVKGQRLKQKLTAEDVIDWKKSGIDEKVIQAALGG